VRKGLVELQLAVVDLVERQDGEGELEDAHHGHPGVAMDGGVRPRRQIEHADRYSTLSVWGHGSFDEPVVQRSPMRAGGGRNEDEECEWDPHRKARIVTFAASVLPPSPTVQTICVYASDAPILRTSNCSFAPPT